MYIKYYLRMIYKNKYVEKIYIVCDVDVVKIFLIYWGCVM